MQKGILVILDGYGEGKPGEFNAVDNANTPTLKALKKQSYSLLKTHGDAVVFLNRKWVEVKLDIWRLGPAELFLPQLKR